MKDKGQWENLGNELRDLVEDAITSNNYSELSKNITNIVTSSIDEVRMQIRNSVNADKNITISKDGKTVTVEQPHAAANYGYNPKNSAGYNGTPNRDLNSVIKIPKQNTLIVKPKSYKAITKEIVGYCAAGAFLIPTISCLAFASFQTISTRPLIAAVGFGFGLVSAAFITFGITGTKKRKQVKRFNQYLRTLGNHLYYDISDFARNLGYTEKQVRKDLKDMIREGIFREGHLDKQETCLMITNKMYDQYLETQKNYEESKKQKAASAAFNPASEIKMSAECKTVLKEGEDYIRHINECRSLIQKADMRNKLDRLSQIVSRIFDVVKKDPDKVSELHRMMKFYLPTAGKLLTAYCELENQPITGTNMESTRNEIEASIDTLNEAFEKLLDDLFQDTAWDISSDISVLNTMLAQDGYAGEKIK